MNSLFILIIIYFHFLPLCKKMKENNTISRKRLTQHFCSIGKKVWYCYQTDLLHFLVLEKAKAFRFKSLRNNGEDILVSNLLPSA